MAAKTRLGFYGYAIRRASTSTPDIHATLNVTLGDATLSGAGTLPIVGALSVTLNDATLSAAGTFGDLGTFDSTLPDETTTSDGTVETYAVFDVTLQDATLSATGLQDTLPALIGTLNAALADATLSGAGVLPIEGLFAETLSDATLSSTGTLTHAFEEPIPADEVASGTGGRGKAARSVSAKSTKSPAKRTDTRFGAKIHHAHLDAKATVEEEIVAPPVIIEEAPPVEEKQELVVLKQIASGIDNLVAAMNKIAEAISSMKAGAPPAPPAPAEEQDINEHTRQVLSALFEQNVI